jgi:hypothetical protein
MTFRFLLRLFLILVFFEGLLMADWKKVFDDSGTNTWEKYWFLDGLKASVSNTPQGMVLTSGPTYKDEASHCVLWTKESFEGDIKIEYDFTRLDRQLQDQAVCIIYIQATGMGQAPYSEDISLWSKLRETPSMSTYFNHMHCYHISYACSGGSDFNYVRARRYPSTNGKFDQDTRILPSYDNIKLFNPGETWHFIFEKIGTTLTFQALKGSETHLWKWDASSYAPITSGRIGFRQMWTRSSRYANVRIYQK